jgi:hypothetical protein
MPWTPPPPGMNQWQAAAQGAAHAAWEVERMQQWQANQATANAIAMAQAQANAMAVNNRSAIIASINTHLAAITPGAPPEAVGHITAVQQLLPQLA